MKQSQQLPSNMTRRNAPVVKIGAAVLFVLGIIYFLYIFNETSGKLKDTERVANRYRREQEALSSQLADLRSEKDTLQSRCDNERKEYQNRLSSANQQYKMLQSQNEDLQSEFTRLREDFNKDKEDHKLHDAQQNQEYMQLKQEKDLEIASLKDELANNQREKEYLNTELTKMKTELETSQKQVNSYEMSVNSLQEQNRALETQIGVLKSNILQQQARLQQQNAQQQQVKQQNMEQHPVVDANPVNSLKNAANEVIGNLPNAANQLAGNIQQNVANMGQENVQVKEQDKEKTQEEKNKLIEEQQQQHQVAPPNNREKEEDKLGHKPQLKAGITSLTTKKPESHQPNIQPPKHSKGENSKEKPDVPQVDDGHKQMPPPIGIMKELEKDKNGHDIVKSKEKGELHQNELNQQQNIPPPNVGKRDEKEHKNILESVLKGGLHPNEENQQQNIPPPNVRGKTAKQPMVGGDIQQQNIPPPKQGQRLVDDSVRPGEPLKISDLENRDAVKQPAMPHM